MNTTMMYNLANSASYYSRSQVEILAAINAGARYVYQAVCKEVKGEWIVFDTTSITIVSGVQEYTLPVGVQTVLRLRERINSADYWRVIHSAELGSWSQTHESMPGTPSDYDYTASMFTFYGPYLPAATVEGPDDVQTFNIRFSPIPTDTRQVELVYAAKIVEMTEIGNPFFIPDDGREAVLDYAIAELLKKNGDDRAEAYYATFQSKLTMFLTLVRDRQLQDQTVVTPYIEDLD
jgi:hypothetical protein